MEDNVTIENDLLFKLFEDDLKQNKTQVFSICLSNDKIYLNRANDIKRY